MRHALSLVVLLAALAGSVAAATFAVDAMERSARAGVARALHAGGFTWARFWVDGLQVVMTGTAPDEAARFGAISAVGGVVDAARVVDRMAVEAGEALAPPDFSLEILRNADGVSLIGLVPAATDRARMLDRLGRIADAPVTDLMEAGDYPVPPTWDAALDFALAALARMTSAKVSVAPDRVAVTGVVESDPDKRQIEQDLARAVPKGVRLALDIAAPRPVIAPFAARFVRTAAGGLRVDACAADTAAARDAILAAAATAGAAGRVACPLGIGAPSAAWGEAVATGLAALGDLGEGKLTFTDADIALVVPHTVAAGRFDGAVGRLQRALPPGFSLTANRLAPPAAESEETPGEDGPAEFAAIRAGSGEVFLRGRLPDARIQSAVESYAHSHFSLRDTRAETRVTGGLPAGWGLRALAAIDALALLSEGEVRVTSGRVTVAGTTGIPTAQADIAGLLGERLPDGADFEIDVAYLAELDPYSGLPTAEECVLRLEAVQSVRKITFEPGASTIDGEGLEIVGQLADILRECPALPLEIAGHTDSQGREEMNLELSQARADAVLAALMARRVLAASFTARGYGEADPIADNDSEAGREANRRIEFTLRAEDGNGAGNGDGAGDGDGAADAAGGEAADEPD